MPDQTGRIATNTVWSLELRTQELQDYKYAENIKAETLRHCPVSRPWQQSTGKDRGSQRKAAPEPKQSLSCCHSSAPESPWTLIHGHTPSPDRNPRQVSQPNQGIPVQARYPSSIRESQLYPSPGRVSQAGYPSPGRVSQPRQDIPAQSGYPSPVRVSQPRQDIPAQAGYPSTDRIPQPRQAIPAQSGCPSQPRQGIPHSPVFSWKW